MINKAELRELINSPIRFMETFFLLESEGWKTIRLQDWQKKFTTDLFDPKVTLAILSVCKGLGKSHFCAALGLYFACRYPGSEVLLIANSREQAQTLVYDAIKGCVEHSPVLSATADVFRAKIEFRNGSVIKTLPSKPKTVAGLRARDSLVVFDEAWGSDEAMFSELTDKASAKVSKTIISSYAGVLGASPLLRRMYLLGTGDDKPDDMLFLWDKDPLISDWVTPEYLASQEKKLLPGKYAQYFTNSWSSPGGAFILKAEWDKCYSPSLLPCSDDTLQFAGLDLGLKSDHACFATIIRDGDLYKLASFKRWVPADAKGGEVNIEGVYNHILDLHQKRSLSGVWYDPRYAAGSLAQRLREKGVAMHEVSPQPASISRVYSFLRELVVGQRLEHWGGHLSQYVLNAISRDSSYGPMLDKSNRRAKIDGAVALSLSIWGASLFVPVEVRAHRRMAPPRRMPDVPTSSSWMRRFQQQPVGMGANLSQLIKQSSR